MQRGKFTLKGFRKATRAVCGILLLCVSLAGDNSLRAGTLCCVWCDWGSALRINCLLFSVKPGPSQPGLQGEAVLAWRAVCGVHHVL